MGWATTLDVVVPVSNEERALPGCIEVLSRYLAERFPLEWDHHRRRSSACGTASRRWSRSREPDRRGLGVMAWM